MVTGSSEVGERYARSGRPGGRKCTCKFILSYVINDLLSCVTVICTVVMDEFVLAFTN